MTSITYSNSEIVCSPMIICSCFRQSFSPLVRAIAGSVRASPVWVFLEPRTDVSFYSFLASMHDTCWLSCIAHWKESRILYYSHHMQLIVVERHRMTDLLVVILTGSTDPNTLLKSTGKWLSDHASRTEKKKFFTWMRHLLFIPHQHIFLRNLNECQARSIVIVASQSIICNSCRTTCPSGKS